MKFESLRQFPLIMLISAFIALDFTLLFINLNLTERLNQDAKIINLTGRQRMLSQKISKHLLLLTYSANVDRQDSKQALLRASELFNTTLSGLQQGGAVIDADGSTRTINAIQDAESQDTILETQRLWQPIYELILTIGQDAVLDRQRVDLFAEQNSTEILRLMNLLTVRAEQISKSNTRTLRIAQIVIFMLALVNFFTIVMRLHNINRNHQKLLEQMKQMVQNLAEAVLLVDARKDIVFANDAAARIIHRTPDELIGQSVSVLLGKDSSGDTVHLNQRHYRSNTAVISNTPHLLRMISLLDITEQHELKRQSTEDALTGALNRIGLTEAYRQLCQEVEGLCCLFLDLDGFKRVNDQYGHSIGDKALHIISQRFRSCLKSSDILARVGGDEFVILIGDPRDEEAIAKLCQRLETTISRRMDIDGNQCTVGVSIGVQYCNCEAASLDEIIREADEAMYKAKQAKKQ